ncbi:MAG: hypothetical protein BWY12_00439 [candidate division BRC1 bacterium ADurb.Bin183]|nr:MAG: hypothetical protein BWY12_00439 [candidate division BRC1 bacterium ADurb.Bin183]
MKNLGWFVLCLVSVVFSAGYTYDLPPLQSLPIDYYIENGLLPDDVTPKRYYEEKAPGTISKEFRTTLSAAASYQIDLRKVGGVNGKGIIFKNTGTADIINPWLVINKNRDWFSTSSMLAEILGDETDPKKRAFLIWSFIKQNRYHWYPAEAGNEIHDPVKYLNVYGYGFCDDSAVVSEALFKNAGFADARCWGLSGHVVPEVYYNSAWHMLDADLEVFYPKRDNIHVASVEECAADGWLVRRISSSSIVALYTSTSDNFTYKNAWTTAHTMAITLRPGEQLERYWHNWGKYHDFCYYKEPPRYGNGRLLYAPDLSSNIFKSGFQTVANIETFADSNTSPLLHLKDAGKSGDLVCKMSSPYLFVGGTVQLDAFCSGTMDKISVEFSKDTYSWKLLKTVDGPASSTTEINLDSSIGALSSPATYTFFIRLTLQGSEKNSVGINRLTILGDIQCAPAALPALRPAMINKCEMRFVSAAGGALEVIYQYDEFPNLAPPKPPISPTFPSTDDTVASTAPILEWEDPNTTATIVSRQIMVSWGPLGILPVTPLAWEKIGAENIWQVPDGWLLDGYTYYWRVRSKNKTNWSRWSDPWSFTIQLPVPLAGFAAY